MQQLLHRKTWLAAAVVAVLSLAIGTAFAHEGREAGDYRLVVGFVEEPAYEGAMNGVDVRVTKVRTGDGHGDDDDEEDDDDDGGMSMGEDDGHGETAAVEGLEKTLQVEITHVSTGASKVMSLRALADEPGRYTADLIPTAPGVYRFRLFGAIEGNPIDETFLSRGGGGNFADVQSSTELQFPERLPELREVTRAVRGAMSAAQQAQDAAMAADEGDDDSAGALLILAIALGGAGVSLGSAGLIVGLRLSRRR